MFCCIHSPWTTWTLFLHFKGNYCLKSRTISWKHDWSSLRTLMSVFTTNWFLKDDWIFLSTERYHYQRSQITKENRGLILCDDNVLGCFGMWARACWHQEANVLSIFQPSSKAELGSALQSRCWKSVLCWVWENGWEHQPCSELGPCCTIPAVLRGRSPFARCVLFRCLFACQC